MALTPGTIKIIESRNDLSPYLFHFTKNANAFATLQQILKDGKLLDMSKSGHICFSEAPLTSMGNLFDIFNRHSNPTYAPFGVAINRAKLFDMGARPVIYGGSDEHLLLDESIRWRFQYFNPNITDFTWLRGWRIQLPELNLSFDDMFIITQTEDQLLELTTEEDVLIDTNSMDGQHYMAASSFNARTYKAIALDEMLKLSLLSDHDLRLIIEKQKIGDDAQNQR
ncbi:hypothetical protein MUGA111182_04920 [Mucilaginibacter galii]|uniref:Uncharacterized protein n=1 Tax=Mucilaginibacter galii TaxID=2005073 RepID=A0A917N1F1_9SPHI|nr:hypothetical protein [Mucilaginibacter galii]GGI50781.1 hypothetical protein GCM10011425_19930 [Mucilaginibacter galii]